MNSFQFSNFQILEDFPIFQTFKNQFSNSAKRAILIIFFCQKATYLVFLMTSELNFKTHKVHFPQKYQAFKFWKIEVCNKIRKLEDRFFEILENWKSILPKIRIFEKLEEDKWMEPVFTPPNWVFGISTDSRILWILAIILRWLYYLKS